PGALVEVDLATLGCEERPWYEPADAVDPERAAGLASQSRRDLADELERELRASVRRRLMADVPVGEMCSGALDSSLVAALAREDGVKVLLSGEGADELFAGYDFLHPAEYRALLPAGARARQRLELVRGRLDALRRRGGRGLWRGLRRRLERHPPTRLTR